MRVMQAIIDGFSTTDGELREQCKRQGCMATVAFVCGDQLVVATSGTSQAHLDTGTLNIYQV